MLVVTRKVGQRIQIGPDIYVTIVRVDGNCVRLGIDAPAHVAILRDDPKFKKENTDDHADGTSAAASAVTRMEDGVGRTDAKSVATQQARSETQDT